MVTVTWSGWPLPGISPVSPVSPGLPVRTWGAVPSPENSGGRAGNAAAKEGRAAAMPVSASATEGRESCSPVAARADRGLGYVARLRASALVRRPGSSGCGAAAVPVSASASRAAAGWSPASSAERRRRPGSGGRTWPVLSCAAASPAVAPRPWLVAFWLRGTLAVGRGGHVCRPGLCPGFPCRCGRGPGAARLASRPGDGPAGRSGRPGSGSGAEGWGRPGAGSAGTGRWRADPAAHGPAPVRRCSPGTGASAPDGGGGGAASAERSHAGSASGGTGSNRERARTRSDGRPSLSRRTRSR